MEVEEEEEEEDEVGKEGEEEDTEEVDANVESIDIWWQTFLFTRFGCGASIRSNLIAKQHNTIF